MGENNQKRNLGKIIVSKRKHRHPYMKMSFGNFIRMKRLEARYTLRKFAKEIEISPTFISRMERDEIDPPGEDKISAMAQVLSIDAEWLILMAGKVLQK